MAPLPLYIGSALEALSKMKSGFLYHAVRSDGSKVDLTEAQVVGEIADFLRSQTQLVVGYAVSVEDLIEFLQEKGMEP